MRPRVATALALAAVAAAGCFQEIDSSASSATNAGPLSGPSVHTVDLMTPTIPLGPGDDAGTTDEPCLATTNDAMNVLRSACSGCHGGGPGQNLGQPPFDYVLDVPKLLTAVSETVTDPVTMKPVRFLVPGDPDHSRIYVRMFTRQMPPGDVVGLPPNPSRPSVSDISVMRQWIAHCLGTDAPDGTGSQSSSDAAAVSVGEADAAAAADHPAPPGGQGSDAHDAGVAYDAAVSGADLDAAATDVGPARRFDGGMRQGG
jgi:hypothetical protein